MPVQPHPWRDRWDWPRTNQGFDSAQHPATAGRPPAFRPPPVKTPSPPSADSNWIPLELPPQPTDTSCGPTCLHGLYRFYGRNMPLDRLLREIDPVPGGGTLGVLLGNHALEHGFQVRMVTWNLRVFDPTWFPSGPAELAARLRASLPRRHKPKLRQAIQAYIRFCELGGDVSMEVLGGALLRRPLRQNHPVLAGLSSTFLYRDARSNPATNADDDLGGEAEGHFVLLTGYDREARTVQIADPYARNPIANQSRYAVPMDRLINAILLGVLTYDANLLVITPRS